MEGLPGGIHHLAQGAGQVADGATVRLTQEGEMRLKPGGRWASFRAEQTISIRSVAFRWQARVRMAPLMSVTVEDSLAHGHGRLAVKLWGLLPIASAKGAEVDQGEAQRYLAELPWNPLALRCNRELRFGEGEDGGHRVWWNRPECHVDLYLDEQGRVTRTLSRTRPRDGDAVRPWEGRFADYEDMDGVQVPRRGEVAWLLPEGRFDYWRGTIRSYEIDSEGTTAGAGPGERGGSPA